jgi:hypothetical protein
VSVSESWAAKKNTTVRTIVLASQAVHDFLRFQIEDRQTGDTSKTTPRWDDGCTDRRGARSTVP